MTQLFAAEFFAIAVALFLIAYGVLRPPARTAAPAHQTTAKPAVFRRDVVYINSERRGAGAALREAYSTGYTFSARDGAWITLRRNG